MVADKMPGKISKVTGIASKRNEVEKPPKKSTKVRRIREDFKKKTTSGKLGKTSKKTLQIW